MYGPGGSLLPLIFILAFPVFPLCLLLYLYFSHQGDKKKKNLLLAGVIIFLVCFLASFCFVFWFLFI
jgi:hypothetical protein